MLTIPRRGGLSFELGDGSAADRLTFSGNLADVTADLHGILFTPAADAYGIVTLTLGARTRTSATSPRTSDTTISCGPSTTPRVGTDRRPRCRGRFNGLLHGPCARHRRDHVDLLARRRPRGGRDRPDDGRLHVEARCRAGAWLVQFPCRVGDGGTPDLTDRQPVTVTVSAPAPALAPGSHAGLRLPRSGRTPRRRTTTAPAGRERRASPSRCSGTTSSSRETTSPSPSARRSTAPCACSPTAVLYTLDPGFAARTGSRTPSWSPGRQQQRGRRGDRRGDGTDRGRATGAPGTRARMRRGSGGRFSAARPRRSRTGRHRPRRRSRSTRASWS